MSINNKYEYTQLVALSSEIRKLTLKRLEEVHEGFFNWRLNNTAMSFAHLAQHIINVDDLFFELATTNNKNFSWKMGTEEPHVNISKDDYSSIIKKLKEYGIKREELISNFDNTSIAAKVTNENGEEMTLWWFLMHLVLEHETYHRGQISAYLKVVKGEVV